MPFFSRRILVSLCPFVNLDLFKKGFYHIAVRLVDKNAEQSLSKIECLEIKDVLGPEVDQFEYPGPCRVDDHFITQTSLVEYSEQSFPLGECFIFKLESPILGDHTDAYLPSSLALHLELQFSAEEELPKDPCSFTTVSSRTLLLSVDWRKGLHDHFPVLFDYFHMAAVGVTVHASLVGLCLDNFLTSSVSVPRLPQRRPSFRSNSRRWSQSSTPSLPSLHSILFGTQPLPQPPPPGSVHPLRSFSLPGETKSSSSSRSLAYLVPERQLERAQEAHQMLCVVLHSARESLHAAGHMTSGEVPGVEIPVETGDLSEASTREDAESVCSKQIAQLNASLGASWAWFCGHVAGQLEVISHLATASHHQHLQYSQETLVSQDHPFFKNAASITDPSRLSLVAGRVRKTLSIPMSFYCKENVETCHNSSVIFVEPPSWPALEGGSIPLSGEATSLNHLPGTAPGLQGFTRCIRPYLMDALPKASRTRRPPAVHLVVCVHGLQGNQFDLRLYRIFLTLALPQVRFSFLMASANQADTFCDFNLMTDRLLEEVLEHVQDMPTPPSKVSFIGHSLGSIVVRSLVTRPEFAFLHPKLHLYISICGPHLGTKYQNGIVSVGMWAVRKWYNSKSLLQLSLKDAPNPSDSFLYHLSESSSLEYFRHVVLLASPQDKYVPYHSAKISTLSQDAAFQSSISLRIMHNILEPLRKAHVNLVRLSVEHAIPTSANSFIGRAAHIAMLDNEIFIRKLVSLHLAQYFIES